MSQVPFPTTSHTHPNNVSQEASYFLFLRNDSDLSRFWVLVGEDDLGVFAAGSLFYTFIPDARGSIYLNGGFRGEKVEEIVLWLDVEH